MLPQNRLLKYHPLYIVPPSLPINLCLSLPQEVCHLLSDIETYYKEALPGSSFDLSHMDDPNNESKTHSEYEFMDLENLVYEKVSEAKGI